MACDELIFLPGTPHEFRCSVGVTGERSSAGSNNTKNSLKSSVHDGEAENMLERADEIIETGEQQNEADNDTISPLHACYSEGDADAAAGGAVKPLSTQQHSQSLSTLDTLHLETPTDSEPETPSNVERRPLMIESTSGSNSAPTSPSLRSRFNSEDSPLVFIRDQALKGIDMLVIRKPLRPPPLPTDDEFPSVGEDGQPNTTSTNNEVHDAEYAPSAPQVLGAAMDMSLPVLFNFHMFVVLMKDHYRKEAQENEEELDVAGSSDTSEDDGKVDVSDYTWMTPPQVPPKVLPLFFITPLIIRSMVPPRQRRRFYKTLLQGTILSPFKPVRFRDAFVADCLTSLVRPIGDMFYALAYYFTAIGGLLSGRYDLNKAGYIVSESWILHGLVLPALSIVPLYIKFLQSLRQAYDTGKRWPYLGNAFKYLTAGLVILYGMTHAAGERSPWWIWAFVSATIYQTLWDSFIDWELLVIVPREPFRLKKTSCSRLFRVCRCIRDVWERVRLRPKRLFDDDSFYWKALFANAGLRFCWMIGFIPAYRVSVLDGSMQVTFIDNAHGWSFVLLATLEILRRTIWGIIKLELETIKLTSEGDDDLSMASTADEYIREGKWKVPSEALRRSNKSVKSTLEAEVTKAGWLNKDSPLKKYTKLEQSELEAPSLHEVPIEKRKFRWLCMSVSSGFLRWMFICELLLWPCACLVLSYYIILAN